MSIRIYGNRTIKTLPGQTTRPTPSKVREALFNIWQGRVQGCRWLDLCAGSGAMGAEALCRGASVVVGIEQSGLACRITHTNWQTVAKPEQSFQVIRGDVVKKIKSLNMPPFDLVYFDPPYGAKLYDSVLQTLVQTAMVAPGATIAAEHSSNYWQPQSIAGLELGPTKRYGLTQVAFFDVPGNVS